MGASGVSGELAAAEMEGRPASLQAAWLRLLQTDGGRIPPGPRYLGLWENTLPQNAGQLESSPKANLPLGGPWGAAMLTLTLQSPHLALLIMQAFPGQGAWREFWKHRKLDTQAPKYHSFS